MDRIVATHRRAVLAVSVGSLEVIAEQVLASLMRVQGYQLALDFDFNAMDNWVWLDKQWHAGKMVGAKYDKWRW
jgi:hypothetical protein